jgi:hypothetical protein
MRSAAVAVFAGLATASYLPPAAPVYEVPGVSAPASSAAVASSAAPVTSEAPVYSEPAEHTEYSTQLVTITSCAPDVPDCPAASTVVSSSLIPLTTSTICESPESFNDHPGMN